VAEVPGSSPVKHWNGTLPFGVQRLKKDIALDIVLTADEWVRWSGLLLVAKIYKYQKTEVCGDTNPTGSMKTLGIHELRSWRFVAEQSNLRSLMQGLAPLLHYYFQKGGNPKFSPFFILCHNNFSDYSHD
jgi:hypothetical protein